MAKRPVLPNKGSITPTPGSFQQRKAAVCVKPPDAPFQPPAPKIPCPYIGVVTTTVVSVNPIGGPASGLWQNNAGQPAAAQAPAPTPAPPPAPSCTAASTFADCFGGAPGNITPGSPGPVQGWTWSNAFGPKGGRVTFTPGVMSLDNLALNNTPGATKSLLVPLAGVLNLTVQFRFTEYPLPVGTQRTYDFIITDQALANFIDITLRDDGFVFISIGDVNNADNYFGTWTAVNGAAHKVDFSVDGANVPTLYIDDVLVPLTFSGGGGSIFGVFPANSVAVFSAPATATVASSKISNLFVTSGNLPGSTVYCCP